MIDNNDIYDEIELLEKDAKMQESNGHSTIANRYKQIVAWLEELCILREKHEMLAVINSLRGINMGRCCNKEQISNWLAELYDIKSEQEWRLSQT